jgi:SAM-dependent methyltransferase
MSPSSGSGVLGSSRKRELAPAGRYSSPDELGRLGIELEFVGCAACGSDAQVPVLVGRDRLHNLPGRFRVVRCLGCGLLRTNPRPTVGSMARYYPADYEPYTATAIERPRWRQALARLVDSLDVAAPAQAPGDLLEIGAGAGNYLLSMQHRGWRVTGVEFDAAAAAVAARRTGAVVHAGDLLSKQFPSESFDRICGWMVFEHLHDPVAAFERCLGWLRPGGWLCFSVPDAGSWQFRIFADAWFALQLPTHLYHFSRDTLISILTARGYTNTSVRWQRTWFDVGMSVAYVLEDSTPKTNHNFQRLARSLPARALARAAGVFAGPLKLSGRLTAWAQRPRQS